MTTQISLAIDFIQRNKLRRQNYTYPMWVQLLKRAGFSNGNISGALFNCRIYQVSYSF